jgi:hypothetical protein
MHLRSLLSFSLFSVCACSADHSGPHGGDADASLPDGGIPDGRVSASLAAPVLASVKPMHGGLHVTWENKEVGCDAIEGERKESGDYKALFSIPDGSVDNKHDALVKAGTTYTYRVRCKKGDDYSTYSNEMAGSP